MNVAVDHKAPDPLGGFTEGVVHKNTHRNRDYASAAMRIHNVTDQCRQTQSVSCLPPRCYSGDLRDLSPKSCFCCRFVFIGENRRRIIGKRSKLCDE